MRHAFVRLTLAVWLVAPAIATAGTVTLRDWTDPGHFFINAPNGGGAFEAVTTGDPLGDRRFLTFCLEFQENFVVGSTYNYTLNTNAIYGGVGPSGDPLSNATKWLYYNAVTGGYVGLLNAIPGSDLAYAGSYIQQAIWHLENERTASGVALTLANNANLLINKSEWIALENQGHRIWAMNLTNAAGNLRQDQLVYVSVPDAGSTLALLASVGPVALVWYLGAGASRVVRRRRRSTEGYTPLTESSR